MQITDYYLSERKDIFPFIPQGIQKTLDVGCATGGFSTKLKKERNTESWGIEMQEDVAKIAKTKLDKVLVGSFDEVAHDLPQHYFDCIFFNDVLEHMSYPETCLTKIKANLRPDGKIIASIPNMRHISVLRELILKKDWKYEDSGILDRTHLRFFTKKSIIRMFEDCGYRVDLIKGINGVSPYCFTSLINMALFNSLNDTKYRQFLVVASPA